MHDDVKSLIQNLAAELGFHRTVIGSMEPLDIERKHFEAWLAKGYHAGMEWLNRNPQFRTSPALLLPSCRSAVVVSASYYTETPSPPQFAYGRVARYAVGLDYHAVLRAKLRALKAAIETKLGRPLAGKAFTDDVALYEQAFANRHGLGFKGKNTMIIGPKLSGSFNFVAELFTDLDLEPDEPYQGTCGKCFRCGVACPTEAITPSGVDAGRCISYLTIENKGGIPLELRPLIGEWVYGCDICQEVCPYNQSPPPTPWIEFSPTMGAGHYLDLHALLSMSNEEQFREKFGHSPIRRPKLKGMQRNALVVLGNRLAKEGLSDQYSDMHGTCVLLNSFLKRTTDPMLQEHAEWALHQARHGRAPGNTRYT